MQRNIIVFILLSALILGGWFWFITNMNSDAEKRLAQIAKDKEKEKDKEPKEKKKPEEIVEKPKPKNDKGPVKKLDVQDEPSQSETLGGDGFHLTVTTTTRGAGIRKVVLNRFESADWRGRPVLDKEGHPVPLELIQDDDHAPSYRMYPYAQPKDDHPVFGLGEKIWKFEGKKKLDEDGQEVRYSTTVPDMDHLKIVKVYTLAPKAYHVTLLLEFHDTRTAKDLAAIPFRYQLTGAQGLPIEGEWYTAIFRNAIMGLADLNGSLFDRKLEDSLRISARRGGDRFPETTGGVSRLQYAGVTNQYFAAMLAVDDKQPTKDEGGFGLDKILAWSRPTLETKEITGIIEGIKDDILRFTNLSDAKRVTHASDGAPIVITSASHGLSDGERVTISGIVGNKTANGKFKVKVLTEDTFSLDGSIGDGPYKSGGLWGKEYQFTLLPRTKKHLEDLDLPEGRPTVLSTYETDNGKRIASWVRLGETLKPQFNDITVRVHSEVIELSPGVVRKHQFILYHGPIKAALLGQFTGDKEVPADLVERYTHMLNLRTLTDYHSDNVFGRVSSTIHLTDLIIFFTRLMHWLLNLLHSLISWIPGSYGISIIILTVMVRATMFPISRKQALFSIKMQELAPELKKLQEKYPDDPTAKMQAQQEFYRKHGINPLGSCWPVFLQMPIFLGLYFALQESIHFRLAEFLWIKNLAAPDMLIYWTENIPYISAPDHGSGLLGALYLGPYLNILPMIAVVFMMIQQMQTMPPPTDDQQATQQKLMKYMSIVFGIMFYKVAAGLCMYFIASSLWGMAERKLLPKKKPLAEFPGSGGSPPPGGTGGPKGSTAPVKGGKGKWDKNKDKDQAKEAITSFDKLKNLWQEIRKQAEKK